MSESVTEQRIPLNALLHGLLSDAMHRVDEAERVRDTIVQTVLASQGILEATGTTLDGTTLVVSLPVPSAESMR